MFRAQRGPCPVRSRVGSEPAVRCWPCPAGVPSRDATAGLGRTVWSTTTNRQGRCVERPPECRGRLVWRTRRRWGRSASVVAPGAPGGGAIARADPSGWALTLGRARILRSALQRRGTGGTLRTPSDANRTPATGERVEETCPRGSDRGPVRRRRMSHSLPTGYAPPPRLCQGGPHAGAPTARSAL